MQTYIYSIACIRSSYFWSQNGYY